MNWWVILAAMLAPLVTFGADRKLTTLRDWLRDQDYEQIGLRQSGENRLFLFGRLDGRRRSVLVDTGWSFTTVSTSTAEKLKPRPEVALRTNDHFSGAPSRLSAVLMSSLKLGSVDFTNQPALVEEMVFNGKRAPFDVVLGCDFLLRNFALIDCENRRLYARRVAPSEAQQADFEQLLRQSGFLAVELTQTTPLALACTARLDGRFMDLLVDTGAAWSCLDTGLAKSLGLKLMPTPRQITGVGATGQRAFAVARVNSIELGKAKLPGQNFAVLDLGDWGLAVPGAALAGVRGILGGPELARLNAIIDCHGLRLWIKPANTR